MSDGKFAICGVTPLFTLTHAYPEESSIRKCFHGWPSDKADLLSDADDARELILQHLRQEGCAMQLRLEDLNRYLPLALAIEKEKNANPKITVNKEEKLKWRQTPIVVSKYVERCFNGNYFSVEVLHVIWLRAIELLNNGYVLYQAEDIEASSLQFREVAGIFHFLASDRLRVTGGESVPIEFQAPVFNSLMTLSLGQAYALIAMKGELDGLPNSALGKLCYTVSATYGSALDAIKSAKPDKVIHEQYVNWLIAVKAYYHACAALHLAFANKAKDAIGKGVGLLRVAIADLTPIGKLDKHNKRVNEAAANLLAEAKKIEPVWTQDNFHCQSEYVPSVEETEMFISSTCTSMPSLPQPVPFNMPEPAGAPAA